MDEEGRRQGTKRTGGPGRALVTAGVLCILALAVCAGMVTAAETDDGATVVVVPTVPVHDRDHSVTVRYVDRVTDTVIGEWSVKGRQGTEYFRESPSIPGMATDVLSVYGTVQDRDTVRTVPYWPGEGTVWTLTVTGPDGDTVGSREVRGIDGASFVLETPRVDGYRAPGPYFTGTVGDGDGGTVVYTKERHWEMPTIDLEGREWVVALVGILCALVVVGVWRWNCRGV